MKNKTGDERSVPGCGSRSRDGTSLEEGTDGCGLEPSVDTWGGWGHMNGSKKRLQPSVEDTSGGGEEVLAGSWEEIREIHH